jgi:hypothetical protein
MKTMREDETMRRLLLGLAIALAVQGLGCRSFQRADTNAPSPYLVAEGRAKIDPILYADQAPWALAFSGPLEATGEAPLDASIADAGQRALMARAEARRAGLRQLAQRVMALPDADGRPLSQSVAKNGELAMALETMLEEHAKIQWTVAGGKAQAKTTIQGQDLLVLLRDHGVSLQFRLSNLPEARRQVLKGDVYGQALADMRKRLKEQILSVVDVDGRPLRNVFERHPGRVNALNQALLLLQADSIRYQEDGSCTAQAYFEQAKAVQLAHPAAPWWALWRAFAE